MVNRWPGHVPAVSRRCGTSRNAERGPHLAIRHEAKETAIMNKTDMQLKKDVEDELQWEPKINAARIGVSARNGAVSLTGEVDTYPEKWAAEDAAKRVGGVRSVAEDLTVKILGSNKHTDAEIAEAALRALKWDVWVPDTVTLAVQEGRITLNGQVEWKYQSDSAENAVSNLAGVASVDNQITIKPRASAAKVKEKVEAALQRQATADAKSIRVDTSGSTVTLSGQASSWRAIDNAAAAAWAVPGVTEVIDTLSVNTL
jgi:VCBS repeat-containing protein